MEKMVRCAYCGGTYNLSTVAVTARYSDCSVWNSPCCNRVVDDRGETGWKSNKDYYVIDTPEDYLDYLLDSPFGPIGKRRKL